MCLIDYKVLYKLIHLLTKCQLGTALCNVRNHYLHKENATSRGPEASKILLNLPSNCSI